mgnify:CR=1 FL=1|tara:strand:+ start:56 stop:508 length:453 start_codon:yes stop_codon:yes gene_type:complete
MPKFEKSTGYKMKGSTFYGKSPLKISDKDVVAAQAQLDKVETKFRQPGWAKAAYKAVKTLSNPMSKDTDIEEGGEQGGNGNGGGGSEEKTQSVSEKMANTSNLESKDSGNKMQNSFYPNYKAGDASGGIQGLQLGGSPAPYRERVDNKRR